ncbi:MAG TPA: ABC transporter permease [Planctomycetota bacterium]|nr:ABC transporter permease [Planctomycetota bacterium]
MRLPGDIDLRCAWGVFMRNATDYKRNWWFNILPNFFEPLLYLLGLGVGLGYYMRDGLEGQGFIAFLAPGLMASAAMNGASFETTYNMFVRMTFARLYDAYLATPAQIQDIAFGDLLWAVFRALIYGVSFAIVVALMSIFGAGIITSPWALLLPPALLLIGVMFALIGQVYTSMIRVIDMYSFYYTLWLTPLFLFSGIFYPVDRFAHGEVIAWFTPLYHAVRVCRGLCHGQVDAALAGSLLWMAAVSALLMALVPRLLRRRFFR